MDLNINRPVPGAKEFYPLNEPDIGTTLSPVRVCQVEASWDWLRLCCTHRIGHSPLAGDLPQE